MAKMYIGITESVWLDFLEKEAINDVVPEKVNFWKPGSKPFKSLEKGELFLFKLHNNKIKGGNGEIIGGGFFDYYSIKDTKAAWDEYGKGNGFNTYQEMLESIKQLAERNNIDCKGTIGCIVLNNVFFLEKPIAEPADWNKSIVSGKVYDTENVVGNEIYNEVMRQIGKDFKADIFSDVLTHNLYGINMTEKNTALSDDDPHISIGWSKLGDLTHINDYDILGTLYDEKYPNDKDRTYNLGVVWKMRNTIEIGDYVVYAYGNIFNIGRVTSEYYYDDDENPNQDPDYVNSRKVKWLIKDRSKSELHQALSNSMIG